MLDHYHRYFGMKNTQLYAIPEEQIARIQQAQRFLAILSSQGFNRIGPSEAIVIGVYVPKKHNHYGILK